jgi:bacterioferritin-associated ferredoxin
MSQLYACLGCRAQCGRCARTIKRIIDEVSNPHTGPILPEALAYQ